MQAKETDPVEVVKEVAKNLADTYLKVAMEQAKSIGYEEVINKLRQQLAAIIINDPCSNSMGWCTPSGSSITQMTQCDCLQVYSGCIDWHAPHPQSNWEAARGVFGDLCHVLAEAYAAHMRKEGTGKKEIEKAANEKVVRTLGRLITEANEKVARSVGICTVALTNPPTAIRMTEAQCAEVPGGTWQPARRRGAKLSKAK